MKTEYQYIHFELVQLKPKTAVYGCLNNNSGDVLGVVQWYPAWRQYCYFPAEPTVYSLGCLRDIGCFVEQLNTEHKAQRAK